MLNYNYFNHMKKKLFFGMAGLAIAAAITTTISTINATTTPELSDLMVKNLEALTQNESGSSSCTGKKETDHWFGRPYCHCENQEPCRDETGCN
ncbi:MAG: NVEALA domain-containing protein [Lachnoclostridium sp.]|nr:NVEALA domain-containing protein [Lachnoclostridium sp.]